MRIPPSWWTFRHPSREKAEALSKALARALAAGGAQVETEEAEGLDIEVLRALGYVD